jgi:hypothetical protein
VEIRRIMVLGQPRQDIIEDPTTTNMLGMIAHTCNPSYPRGLIGRRIVVRPAQAKSKTLNNLKVEKGGDVAQVAGHLPSKHNSKA